MNHTEENNRSLALIGILGGILFSVGDALLYLTPHFDFEHDATLDRDTMPAWRFGMSALFGIGGTAMTAFGHFTLGVWEPLQYKAMTDAGIIRRI